MGWEYSEKTKQLFMDAVHGKPGTHLGEIENPDGVGEHGSIACGDALRFTFRVEKNEDPLKDVIVESKYLTFGCTSAIAASEALCCIIEDRRITPLEALKITNDDIVEFLEGLPQQKIHCSVMGAEALEAAVFDWARRRGVKLSELGIESHLEEEEEGRMVCKCFGLTEPYIKRKIKELNLHTIPEITGAIKAGGGCMSCHHAPGGLQDILNEVWGTKKASDTDAAKPSFVPLTAIDSAAPAIPAPVPKKSPASDNSGLSPYQISRKIEQVIDSYIRPMIQKDGGNIEIFDIKDLVVYVELTGACADCASATQTLKFLVENTLKSQVDERIRIVQV
ncbi:MAG: iron-sulfur cluster assembly scaffold protein [Planctomycetia bacterium]|nr:iron-sulfur cluster assembly scaffold protein [Planctomycetia bacterium]